MNTSKNSFQKEILLFKTYIITIFKLYKALYHFNPANAEE